MPIRIAEIYSSRQGEGLLTGTPSVFVRTSGCNLRCSFCDTPFTSWAPEGRHLSLDDLCADVLARPEQHVVLTGGEPMLPREVVPLTQQLRRAGRHITIETAGTICREVDCDLMSISPKLANSTPPAARAGRWSTLHESRRINLPVLRELTGRWEYQLKFVVAEPADLEEVDALVALLPGVPPDRVLLMPEGVHEDVLAQRETWLGPAASDRGYRLCRRMHIVWFGHQRGT